VAQLQFKKIFWCTVLVFALDLLVGLVALLRVMPELSSDSEEAARQAAALDRTPDQLVVFLVVGTLTTVVGGYVCARWVRRDVFIHALALGGVGLLTALALADFTLPLWFTATGLVSAVPATLLGAVVAEQLHPRVD
jgi:MFS family permease